MAGEVQYRDRSIRIEPEKLTQEMRDLIAYFQENLPARSTVQVAKLPRDAAVEIDVVALA